MIGEVGIESHTISDLAAIRVSLVAVHARRKSSGHCQKLGLSAGDDREITRDDVRHKLQLHWNSE